MFFTDDGFAVGVAYILTILGQHHHFDALHYWDAARTIHATERGALQQKEAELRRKKDRDAAEDLHFQYARLNASQRELDMLFWSFSGARIFFRDA